MELPGELARKVQSLAGYGGVLQGQLLLDTGAGWLLLGECDLAALPTFHLSDDPHLATPSECIAPTHFPFLHSE